MQKKQLKLSQFKIDSFLTTLEDETMETVKGGEPYFTIAVCETAGKECLTHHCTVIIGCPVTKVGCA
ncbi:MAG: pinensin family lanthipeptide [Cyclobacteriaceae bacterium]